MMDTSQSSTKICSCKVDRKNFRNEHTLSDSKHSPSKANKSDQVLSAFSSLFSLDLSLISFHILASLGSYQIQDDKYNHNVDDETSLN